MTNIESLLKAEDDLIKKYIPTESKEPWAPSLYEPIHYHRKNKGKKLRPKSCFESCRAFGGNPRNAVGFAAAIDLFHNFVIIHDDVIDGDVVRRDQNTLEAVYGTKNAIICGDYLFAKSYRILLDFYQEHPRLFDLLDAFTLAAEKTGEGESADSNLHANDVLSERMYDKIAEYKTGYYFAVSLVGGAIIAGASDADIIKRVWDFGLTLGLAYQIKDDLLDSKVSKGRGGETNRDIKRGEPTVLSAYTMNHAPSHVRARVRQILALSEELTSEEDIDYVNTVYYACGALTYAENRAQQLHEKALKMMREIPFEKPEIIACFIEELLKRER